MLDLKRLYWHCRVFRDGKRKGRCPYDLLGLKVPISDWWQLLQMNPEELEQKLLTQDVRARDDPGEAIARRQKEDRRLGIALRGTRER
jgi:hypothetical protein